MAVITPNTNIRLLKLPIDLSASNQLTFTSEQNQTYYFQHIENYLELENATYMRKDGTLNFPTDNPDSIYYYDYCMYQNEEYSDKWFYAYITDVRYLSNNSVAITLETDPYQTWMFDIELEQCFVEREHVSDDTIGLHTVPENLETGEYISNGKVELYPKNRTSYPCVMASFVPSQLGIGDVNSRYGGIISAYPLLVFDTATSLKNYLSLLDDLSKGDSVICVFMVPKELISLAYEQDIEFTQASVRGFQFEYAVVDYTGAETIMQSAIYVESPTTIDGYQPKNNKLFVWPYNYFYVTNNVGSSIEYHYEDFEDNTPSFDTIGSVTPGCSIKTIPRNYKKGDTYNNSITMPKFPICNWTSDLYTNWLTEQGVNLSLSTAGSVASIVGGGIALATGAGATVGLGLIGGGLAGITNNLASTYQHSLTPEQGKGNINCGDITFSSNNFNVPAYKMTIRSEYARIIDKYMSAYGYKVNEIKVPNTTNRPNWNYVKTIGANIHGHIPNDDMNKIKEMFDAGITLWHHATTFLDYSQNNK
jgi:hypothetical protein